MKYTLVFLPEADKDIKRIKRSGDKALYNKLTALLKEIAEHPKTGTGKPELLKHYLIPTWSRRISKEHRLSLPHTTKNNYRVDLFRIRALLTRVRDKRRLTHIAAMWDEIPDFVDFENFLIL